MKRFFFYDGTEDHTVLFAELFLALFCLAFQLGQYFQRYRSFVNFKLVDEHAVENFREVFTAQEVIPGNRADLHDGFVQLQNGYIQGTAAQVKDQAASFVQVILVNTGAISFAGAEATLAHTIGDGSSCRLVDNPFHAETGKFTGFFRSLSLPVVEVGRYTDDRFLHSSPQVVFRILLQGPENKGRKLLRTVFLSLQFVDAFCTHGTFEYGNRVSRVDAAALQGGFPYINGAGLVDTDDRRCQQTSQPVGDDGHIPLFIYSHQRVGGSKINT